MHLNSPIVFPAFLGIQLLIFPWYSVAVQALTAECVGHHCPKTQQDSSIEYAQKASMAAFVGRIEITSENRLVKTLAEESPVAEYIKVIFTPDEILSNREEIDTPIEMWVRRIEPSVDEESGIDSISEASNALDAISQEEAERGTAISYSAKVARVAETLLESDVPYKDGFVTKVQVGGFNTLRNALVPVLNGRRYALFLFADPQTNLGLVNAINFDLYEAGYFESLRNTR